MKIVQIINNKIVSVKEYNHNENYTNNDILISDDNILIGDYDPRIDINILKNKKKKEIDLYFDGVFKSGYETAFGYNLKAEKTDREAFAQDAILHERAITLGLLSNSDNVSFLDSNGIPRILTIGNYRTLLTSYGLWCREKIMQYNGKLYLLDVATTQQDIENI